MSVFGQQSLPINKFSIYLDYNNLDINKWDYKDEPFYTAGIEIGFTETFSMDIGGSFEGNGYMAFPYNPGIGAGGLKNWKYSNTNQTGWAMLRCYPADQWHSESLRIRHKENYGFYFALGYSASLYKRRNLVIESHTRVIDDPINGGQMYVDSSLFHYNGYNITQWGQNFGVGWKQYHNRFIFTDIGIYSDVYRRDNRIVKGWQIADPRRTDPEPYIPQEDWDAWVESIDIWARNGKGLIFRAKVGINLDFYK